MCVLVQLLSIVAVFASDGLARHALIQEKLENYSRVILPNYDTDHTDHTDDGSEQPVNVSINVIIASADSISEATMDYSVTIYLRQWWTDHRLSYMEPEHENITGPLQLDIATMTRLWVPDVHFVNEKRGHFHDITVPNRLLHIYKNGSIFYSQRLSLTLSCYMYLARYPLDSQVCPMTIQSYSYTTENVVLHWIAENPFEMMHDVELPHFRLDRNETVDCTEGYGDLGSYSCVKAQMYLTRNVGYYIIQVYVPSFLIVVLSWVSFWLNVDAVPARISLGVLTVLTITTQTSGLSASLPKVSYIKALDVWMAMCLAFVFSALLEFSVVNVYTRGGSVSLSMDFRQTLRNVRSMRNSNSKNSEKGMNDNSSLKGNEDRGDEYLAEQSRNRYMDRKRAYRVDEFARKAFPLTFVVLNIVYWSVLSHG